MGAHRQARLEGRIAIVVYLVLFALLLATCRAFPDPLIAFFNGFSPGRGRELADQFLSVATQMAIALTAITAVMWTLISALDRVLARHGTEG